MIKIGIEGRLKYLDRRPAWCILIANRLALEVGLMLRHPWEIYIWPMKSVDKSKFGNKILSKVKLETKYYFDLENPLFEFVKRLEDTAVWTFTRVHMVVVKTQRDSLGERDPMKFDGKEIIIYDYTVVKHPHLGRYPEIYAHVDGYKITPVV